MRWEEYVNTCYSVWFQAVPVFFILHNVAEVLTCGYQKCVWKEVRDQANASFTDSALTVTDLLLLNGLS